MGKTGRLTSAADFRRTYSEGKRGSTRTIVAHVRLSDEERSARIGITTARGLGGAVERNRVKRRLREAVRVLRDELRPGTDVVFVGGSGAPTLQFQDMVDSMRRALEAAGGGR